MRLPVPIYPEDRQTARAATHSSSSPHASFTEARSLERASQCDGLLGLYRDPLTWLIAKRFGHDDLSEHSGDTTPTVDRRDGGDEPFLVPAFADEAEVELDRRFPFPASEKAAQVAGVIGAKQVAAPLSYVVGDSVDELVSCLRCGGEADSVSGVHDRNEQGLAIRSRQ